MCGPSSLGADRAFTARLLCVLHASIVRFSGSSVGAFGPLCEASVARDLSPRRSRRPPSRRLSGPSRAWSWSSSSGTSRSSISRSTRTSGGSSCKAACRDPFIYYYYCSGHPARQLAAICAAPRWLLSLPSTLTLTLTPTHVTSSTVTPTRTLTRRRTRRQRSCGMRTDESTTGVW